MSGMTELTVREGDGDASRTGWWMVTGPQGEYAMYATIERSDIQIGKEPERVGYVWYFHVRTSDGYNSGTTHMRAIKHGEGATLDEALEQLRAMWPASVLEEPLQPLVPLSDA
jgi:hypothetical protein